MTASSQKSSHHRPLRLYLIDAHPVARLGLRALFEAQASMTVVGEAATLAAARPAFRLCKPDVVIADTFPIPTPVVNRQRVRVLYLFETVEGLSLATLTQLLTHQHAGFAMKNLPLDRFLKAVQHVAAGRRYRSPAFLRLANAARTQYARLRRLQALSPQEQRLLPLLSPKVKHRRRSG